MDTTDLTIADWKTSTTINSLKLGDGTYSIWYVQLDKDGKVVGYQSTRSVM